MAESLEDIWNDDLMGRRADAKLLQDFLVRRHVERREGGSSGAYVVNLNAGWGQGKTFFMERLARQLSASGHITANVNAWRDDSSQEPMIAVMAAFEASLKPHFAASNKVAETWAAAKANGATILASLAKGAARQLVRKAVGEGLDEASALLERQEEWVSKDVEEALVGNAEKAGVAVTREVTTLLTQFVDQKLTDYQARVQSAATFQSRMREMLSQVAEKGVDLPFFVLIDELDRCRPTYAIEMLEQVKHLFDIDDVVFLIATDGEQLSHAIRAVYGEGFDGKRYLLRFFHRHYRFEQRDRTDFVRYLFETNKIDQAKLGTPFNVDPVEVFVDAMDAYDVTPRDAEQCFDILRSMLTLWDKPVPVQLTIILPLILLHQRHENAQMDAFLVNGGQTFTPQGSWNVRAQRRDEWGKISQVETQVVSLNSALIARAKEPLRNIYEWSRGSPDADYVADVLQEEMGRVHANTLTIDGPRSLINDYPAFVRQVGRLSAPEG
jgi:hypothetical protein